MFHPGCCLEVVEEVGCCHREYEVQMRFLLKLSHVLFVARIPAGYRLLSLCSLIYDSLSLGFSQGV